MARLPLLWWTLFAFVTIVSSAAIKGHQQSSARTRKGSFASDFSSTTTTKTKFTNIAKTKSFSETSSRKPDTSQTQTDGFDNFNDNFDDEPVFGILPADGQGQTAFATKPVAKKQCQGKRCGEPTKTCQGKRCEDSSNKQAFASGAKADVDTLSNPVTSSMAVSIPSSSSDNFPRRRNEARPRPDHPVKGTRFEGPRSRQPGLSNFERDFDERPGSLRDNIPGEPGVDYPTFYQVPGTSFNCDRQAFPAGIYGDVEGSCQVFHVCQLDGRHDSFLCPNGTVFNQRYFVCDWWFHYNCSDTLEFYSLNAELYHQVDESSFRAVMKGVSRMGGSHQRHTTRVMDHSVSSSFSRQGIMVNPSTRSSFFDNRGDLGVTNAPQTSRRTRGPFIQQTDSLDFAANPFTRSAATSRSTIPQEVDTQSPIDSHDYNRPDISFTESPQLAADDFNQQQEEVHDDEFVQEHEKPAVVSSTLPPMDDVENPGISSSSGARVDTQGNLDAVDDDKSDENQLSFDENPQTTADQHDYQQQEHVDVDGKDIVIQEKLDEDPISQVQDKLDEEDFEEKPGSFGDTADQEEKKEDGPVEASFTEMPQTIREELIVDTATRDPMPNPGGFASSSGGGSAVNDSTGTLDFIDSPGETFDSKDVQQTDISNQGAYDNTYFQYNPDGSVVPGSGSQNVQPSDDQLRQKPVCFDEDPGSEGCNSGTDDYSIRQTTIDDRPNVNEVLPQTQFRPQTTDGRFDTTDLATQAKLDDDFNNQQRQRPYNEGGNSGPTRKIPPNQFQQNSYTQNQNNGQYIRTDQNLLTNINRFRPLPDRNIPSNNAFANTNQGHSQQHYQEHDYYDNVQRDRVQHTNMHQEGQYRDSSSYQEPNRPTNINQGYQSPPPPPPPPQRQNFNDRYPVNNIRNADDQTQYTRRQHQQPSVQWTIRNPQQNIDDRRYNQNSNQQFQRQLNFLGEMIANNVQNNWNAQPYGRQENAYPQRQPPNEGRRFEHQGPQFRPINQQGNRQDYYQPDSSDRDSHFRNRDDHWNRQRPVGRDIRDHGLGQGQNVASRRTDTNDPRPQLSSYTSSDSSAWMGANSWRPVYANLFDEVK